MQDEKDIQTQETTEPITQDVDNAGGEQAPVIDNDEVDNAGQPNIPEPAENAELEQGKSESDEAYFARLESMVKAEQEGGEAKPTETAPKQKDEPAPPTNAKPFVNNKPKKTLIPKELMDKLNIPEKFKYMEDILAWGANAENQMKREGQRRAELEKLMQSQQQAPAQANPPTDMANDPQFQNAIEELKLELEMNPVEAMGKLYSEFVRLSPNINGSERQAAIEQANAQAKADMDELAKGMTQEQLYGYIDELKTIAAEHPNISNIKVIDKLLKYKKLEQAQKLDKEQASKLKAKTAGSFPSSASKLTDAQDLESKIRNSESMEELEQYGKQLFAQQ